MEKSEGDFLVRAARRIVKDHLKYGKPHAIDFPGWCNEKKGVFVTLKKAGQLRGCIGFPEPTFSLGDALVKAAVAAASQDPRFEPVGKSEIDKIVVEVTILTAPEKIEGAREELPSKVKVGRDGLIARSGAFSGLLLPQVPVELNWDSRQFLSQTCLKAGLPSDAWENEGTELLSFQGDVFFEQSPNGAVVRKELKG